MTIILRRNHDMLTMGSVILGAETPKICLPLASETLGDITEECHQLKESSCDIVELYADRFNGATNLSHLWNALMMLSMELDGTPLIFTCHTAGLTEMTGSAEEAEEAYMDINRFAVKSGLIDGLNIEYSRPLDEVQELIEYTKDYECLAILSHVLTGAPTYERVVKSLTDMIALNTPAVRLTCPAEAAADVLALLQGVQAVHSAYPDTVLMIQAVGKAGVIANISGETFGSAVAFAALEKNPSAGLLDGKTLRTVLEALH